MSELTDLIKSCLDVHQSIPGSPEYRLALLAKERIRELKADRRIILTQYSEYLGEYGYLDSDWWAEPPNAVDRFLEEQE